MERSRCTVPGVGMVHHFRTRAGRNFGVLAERSGRRSLLVYGADDIDEPLARIVLDEHEADEIAEVLHSRAITDRLASVERLVAGLVGETS